MYRLSFAPWIKERGVYIGNAFVPHCSLKNEVDVLCIAPVSLLAY